MGIFGREDKQPAKQQQGDRHDRSEAPTSTVRSDDLTVISEKIFIDGSLSGTGKVLVDGRVKGKIESRGTVTVAARGRIEASLHAKVVVVSGKVSGNITADDRIELEATANVQGDLTAPRILIKDGAKFMGQVNMRSPETRGEVSGSSARKDRTA
jgi:cytoskeletal protein CcmA (bactofilin family)